MPNGLPHVMHRSDLSLQYTCFTLIIILYTDSVSGCNYLWRECTLVLQYLLIKEYLFKDHILKSELIKRKREKTHVVCI